MRTLVEKEIRLLLPAFAAALALAILPVWLLPFDSGNPGAIPAFLFWFGTVLLALSSFGREIGLKTLPFFVAQPLERACIWWTKVAVLVVFVALDFEAWWLSGSLCTLLRPARIIPPESLALSGLTVAVLTAGGLWMTLLLRQTIAAFWLTLLIPMATITVFAVIGGGSWMICTALGLYAVAAFFLARRQFLHLQDTAWTGGVIAFGGRRAAAEQSARREHSPWAALLRKEAQLQQVTLVGMGGLFLLHLGVVVLRKAGAHVFGKTTLMALDMFFLLWLVVPMLAGSLSVAEERQLGTLDTLLCLPVSRRLQFAVKLFFVLLLGGLSALLLCAAEGIGSAMGVGCLDAIANSFNGSGLDLMVLVFLSLSLLGFYASTLTRGVVPALGTGVIAGVGLWVIHRIGLLWPSAFGWRLLPLMAVPALMAAAIWLAYGNFRYVFEGGRRWWRNILALMAVIVVVGASAAALYHRVWEWAMPLEGSHGPARLPADKPLLLRNRFYSGLSAVLPDGRLWVDRTAYEPGGLRRGGNYFATGSNWVDAFETFVETVGIRSDGTLWVSEKPQWGIEDPLAPLVQYGAETDWQSVEGDTLASVILLKRDGTLWHWGTNSFDHPRLQFRRNRYSYSGAYPGLRAIVPRRLGTDSDWARILRGEQWTYAWKRDGRAWALHDFEPNEAIRRQGLYLAPGSVAERVPEFDHVQFKSLNSYETVLPIEVGVRADGTLWYWKWWAAQQAQRRAPLDAAPLPTLAQIGQDSNWAAVAGGFVHLLALKTDGSIWKWNLVRDGKSSFNPLQDQPERLGTHNDWVALGYWMNDSVALAADGTLWRWSKSALHVRWVENGFLAPARRPAKIENIFDARE